MHLFSKLHYTIYVVFEFCLFKQSNMSNLSIRRIVTKYNSIFDYAKTGLQLLRQRAMIAQLILQRCCLAFFCPFRSLIWLRCGACDTCRKHICAAKSSARCFFSRASCTCGSCARQRFAVTCESFAAAVFCSDAATAFTRVSTRGEANCYAVCFAPK